MYFMPAPLLAMLLHCRVHRQAPGALVWSALVTAQSRPQYHVGTASWTDPTLLKAGFYPPEAKSAEARLRFYAEHFDTVEVDSTYYALPHERNAALWAERTPDDFHFNVKAFALLTQHQAETRALPQPVRELIPKPALQQARVGHPSPEVLQLCFEMFRNALRPLRQAGKLGCILFQFPPWFTARASNEEYIEYCREHMGGDRLAVEFRHSSWFAERMQRTLDFLAERRLSLVYFDAPDAPSIPKPPCAATADVAYIRFHGHNRQAWFGRARTAAERFNYLYSDEELRQEARQLRELAGARTAYVIFNNCYGDYGVRNATTMRRLLTEHASVRPPPAREPALSLPKGPR
jgi:uncharacterized protein YecE (DUF72 family)